MPAQLNHTIVWCRDKQASAAFYAEVIGLGAPRPKATSVLVDAANGISLDFWERTGPIAWQHYAFLVSDAEFVAAMARLLARRQTFWADSKRTQPGAINCRSGGRGLYFNDPDGHLLEIITKPYETDI